MLLVECFKRIIGVDFHLGSASGHKSIVVQEKGNGNSSSSMTFVGGKNIACFGFTAEAGNHEPLALLASQETPGIGMKGVRKMCDGIVVFSQGAGEYILGVELKSGGTKDAHQQTRNGQILCEWLTSLLKEHGHWNGDYKFCNIIAKAPRKTTDKGTTRHNDRYLEPEKIGEQIVLRVRNCNKAYFDHIAKRINQA